VLWRRARRYVGLVLHSFRHSTAVLRHFPHHRLVHTAPRGIGFYLVALILIAVVPLVISAVVLVARQSGLQREAFARAAGFCACRIVALTGWGQEIDRTRSREAGFDHHLVKPVDPEELLRVLLTG
jgi:hypothetical protein